MQKVADRASGSKPEGRSKVDRTGSYAIVWPCPANFHDAGCVELCPWTACPLEGASVGPSQDGNQLRKVCENRFGVGRIFFSGEREECSPRAASGSVPAGHGGARRTAAIAPHFGGDGGDPSSGPRSGDAGARASGGRASEEDRRLTPDAPPRRLSSLRVVDVASYRARNLSALRTFARGGK
jgi:hypothetical protein